MARESLACAAFAVALPALAATPQNAGEKAQASEDHFAPAVELRAGDGLMGAKRLYPSPALYDLNGDGRLDILIGDLRGLITVAQRSDSTNPLLYGEDQPLLARDGKPLNFENW